MVSVHAPSALLNAGREVVLADQPDLAATPHQRK